MSEFYEPTEDFYENIGDYLLEHPLAYAPRRDRTWDSLGREFLLQSDVFTRSSKDDRDTMIATWWGNPSWVYATQNSTDGLWAENVPALTKPMTELDRMVASGVLGNSMLFHRYNYDYDDEDDIAYQTMTIPNNEIVDYIVALVSGGDGRTSPDAMAKVIDALVEK